MRLLKQASVGQVGHHITDAGRTETFTIEPRKSSRADRLSCSNKGLDDRGQDLAFAASDG
jgi:hypothetical protein